MNGWLCDITPKTV